MHDDAECGGGRFASLARDDAVDVVRGRLAAVKDRLGGFVRRRHDLRVNHTTSQWSGIVTSREFSFFYTHVDIWPVDRERAFVLPDDHRHLSVHRIFLPNPTKGMDQMTRRGGKNCQSKKSGRFG